MLLLARRPFHAASAQEVKVDMKDRLAPVFTAIRDDSKTLLCDSLFTGDFILARYDFAKDARLHFISPKMKRVYRQWKILSASYAL